MISPNATLFDQQCYNLTSKDISQFPTISIILQGENQQNLTLIYTPQQYLIHLFYCSSGVGLAVDQEDDFTILGASVLQRYHTVYDRANSRIGFAPAVNCPGA